MSNQNRYIGLDVAKLKTGWAYMDRQKLWVCGTLSVYTDELAEVIEAALAEGIVRAAIEDCYLARGTAGNVKTLKALQDAQTRACVFCEQAGLDWVLVPATAWQSGFNLRGDRTSRKRGARKVADLLGSTAKNQDEADASLISEYAWRHKL